MTTSLELFKELVSDTNEHNFGLHSIDKFDKFEELCEKIVEKRCLELSDIQKNTLYEAWHKFVDHATASPLNEILLAYAIYQLHELMNNILQNTFENDDVVVSAERILEFSQENLQKAALIVRDKAKTPDDPGFIQAVNVLYPNNHRSIDLFEESLLQNGENSESIRQKLTAKKNEVASRLAESILKISKADESVINAAKIILNAKNNPKSEEFIQATTVLWEKGLLQSVSEYIRSTDRNALFQILNNNYPLNLSQDQAKKLQNFSERFTSLSQLPPPSSYINDKESLRDEGIKAEANKYITNLSLIGTVGAILRKTLERPSVTIEDVNNNAAFLDALPPQKPNLFSPFLFLNFLNKQADTEISEQNYTQEIENTITKLRDTAQKQNFWNRDELYKKAFLIITECSSYLFKESTKKTHLDLVSNLHEKLYSILMNKDLSSIEQAIQIYEATSKCIREAEKNNKIAILQNEASELSGIKGSNSNLINWFRGEHISLEKFKESEDYIYLASDPFDEQQPVQTSVYTTLLDQKKSIQQSYLLSFLDERNLYTWALNGVINNCALYLVYHPYPTLKHDGQEFAFKWLNEIYGILNPELDERGEETNAKHPIAQLCSIYQFSLNNFDKTKGKLYENIIAPLEKVLFGEELNTVTSIEQKKTLLEDFQSSTIYKQLLKQPVQKLSLPEGDEESRTLGKYKEQLLQTHRELINPPIEFYLTYRNIPSEKFTKQEEITFNQEKENLIGYLRDLGEKVLNFLFSTNSKIWKIAENTILKKSEKQVYVTKPELKFENIAATMANRYAPNVALVQNCSIEAAANLQNISNHNRVMQA